MTYKAILAAVSGRPDDAAALRGAMQLAKACSAAVTVLPAFPDLLNHLAPAGDAPLGSEFTQKMVELEASWIKAIVAMTDTLKSLEAGDQPLGLGVRVAPRDGPQWLTLLKHVPLTDLTIMSWEGARDPQALGGVLSDVMFNLKAPVLIARGQHPLVDLPAALAWDNSPEAGRALHAAMPLLRKARSVTILQDPDGLDWMQRESAAPSRVVDYLQMHGVLGVSVREVRGSREGPVLLEAAEAMGASILVSGAYSHSRAREWMFGGATRAFLSSPIGPHLLLSN